MVMRTRQAVIESKLRVVQSIPSGGGIGKLVTRMFGCRHKEMSRPFSSQGQAYRTCLDCGANRRFNVGRWEMQGDFYYGLPAARHLRPVNGITTR